MLNGKVLLAGGSQNSAAGFSTEYSNSTEVYDPDTGTWTVTGNLNARRTSHTATLMPDGKVLIAGGHGPAGESSSLLTSAELYDPATGTSSSTGSLTRPGGANYFHEAATLLPNDRVLFVSAGVTAIELYDPFKRAWSRIDDLKFGGFLERVTLLTTGKALVTGNRFDGVTPMGELYTPSPAGPTFFVPVLLSSLGASGSFYSSELAIANRSARDATVEFTYNTAFWRRQWDDHRLPKRRATANHP